MSEAPERIWASPPSIGWDAIGGVWHHIQDAHDPPQVLYRRADLPPTLSAALALPEIAALVEALEWIKRRKPDDIQSDGGMHAPHRGHGEAAFDMWGCAYAALSALRAAREKE